MRSPSIATVSGRVGRPQPAGGHADERLGGEPQRGAGLAGDVRIRSEADAVPELEEQVLLRLGGLDADPPGAAGRAGGPGRQPGRCARSGTAPCTARAPRRGRRRRGRPSCGARARSAGTSPSWPRRSAREGSRDRCAGPRASPRRGPRTRPRAARPTGGRRRARPGAAASSSGPRSAPGSRDPERGHPGGRLAACRSAISAPLPRWPSTCATVQSAAPEPVSRSRSSKSSTKRTRSS